MKKLNFSYNKTLKLTNVIIKQYKLNNQEYKRLYEFDNDINKMEGYAKSKGAFSLGPLIEYTNAIIENNGNINMEIKLLRQLNKYINNIDNEYRMESVIRVSNCMYCRYIGPEDKLKFAYDKINLVAFEEDIPLKGDSYTIFVDRNEEDDTIVADVFMERADND